MKRRRRKKKNQASPGEDEEIAHEDHEEPDEAIEEDDADDRDLEVDVVGGSSRMVRRGTLKAEAKTIQRLLTHRYKNPYCELCIRAKKRHFKTQRGAFKRKLEAFGDLVTFGFIDTQRIMDQGIHTDREIFVIRDRYTGIFWAYPSMEKYTVDVIKSVNHFKGLRKIKIACADKALEFEAAMKELKIPFDHSLPHHPQNIGRKEQPVHHDDHNNMFVGGRSSTLFLESNHAVECVNHILNIEFECGEDEKRPWFKLHGKAFPGEKIPFGAKVYFTPSSQGRVLQKHKFESKGIPGIFAGYEVKPAFDERRPIRKLGTPQLTETIVFMNPIEFPLKEEYERINNILSKG